MAERSRRAGLQHCGEGNALSRDEAHRREEQLQRPGGERVPPPLGRLGVGGGVGGSWRGVHGVRV